MLLGVNIDHVATLRNARGGVEPSVVKAAEIAENNGATSITTHLREDRRHIKDNDVYTLIKTLKQDLTLKWQWLMIFKELLLKLNHTQSALYLKKRQEITTEGGLDVAGQLDRVTEFIKPLLDTGIIVSLFIDPDENQVKASAKTGAQFIEMHTGTYSEAFGTEKEEQEFLNLKNAAKLAQKPRLKSQCRPRA